MNKNKAEELERQQQRSFVVISIDLLFFAFICLLAIIVQNAMITFGFGLTVGMIIMLLVDNWEKKWNYYKQLEMLK